MPVLNFAVIAFMMLASFECGPEVKKPARSVDEKGARACFHVGRMPEARRPWGRVTFPLARNAFLAHVVGFNGFGIKYSALLAAAATILGILRRG